MRVVTYNILEGGVGRADPIGEVLEAQNADVIILVEANDDFVVDRTAKRLNMDMIVAPGHGHRIAILSRFTIIESINHALIEDDTPRSCCQAVIRTPAGIDLPVIGLHMHPKATDADENIRQHQLASVMRLTHEYRARNRPHLLAGDFNSNSPVQEINIAACKASTQDAYTHNGGHIPRRVIQNMLDHGYTDTLHAVNAGTAKTMASFTTHQPGQRVDYVFSFGIDTSKIISAWVEQDRLAKFASDHYPVGTEIDV